MSIMDLFKSSNSTQTSNITSTPPAGENKDLSAAPPSTDASGKNMPGTGVPPGNPLDIYNKLMEDAAKNSDAQAPSFKLDPKVLSDVSSKMDFTQGVDKDMMQKALGGDATALLQVIQTTSQNAYRASLEHGSALTDTFINQRSSYEQKQINNGVKGQLTQQSLSSAPNYDHPVVKQELNRVADQFAKANPDMPPQEIAKAAQKYIQDLSQALAPATQNNSNGTSGGSNESMDWSKYLG